jgi:16S rRNA (guanine966-N2)-methyltransferase
VGGQFRGRALSAPAGSITRPTSDRVREALFNILAHGLCGFDLEGTRVLDLFAGTGALGLEALSRGARFCLFVEEDAEARGAIRMNIEAFGLTGVTKVWRRDAAKLGSAAPMQPFTLVFADPPYGTGLGELALGAAAGGGWLADGAIAVLEERRGAAISLTSGFTPIDSRAYGDTSLHFFRWVAP